MRQRSRSELADGGNSVGRGGRGNKAIALTVKVDQARYEALRARPRPRAGSNQEILMEALDAYCVRWEKGKGVGCRGSDRLSRKVIFWKIRRVRGLLETHCRVRRLRTCARFPRCPTGPKG